MNFRGGLTADADAFVALLFNVHNSPCYSLRLEQYFEGGWGN
jgi:hypothetical protein